MSQETVAALKARFPDAVYDVIEAFGETMVVIDRAIICEACALLRDTPGLDYNFIADITGVDYYPDAPRFAVCYHLYSMLHNRIIRLKVYAPEDDAVIPSLIGEWPLVNWPEREIQDMLGIDFEGHPRQAASAHAGGLGWAPAAQGLPIGEGRGPVFL
ncbi:MAG: NADH-quinone oxidoreductase subunit C [Anaerolineae bacterium]|nr:NADH-quinone oxidoreductase subunit C [Anaerolineae bacterium]